MLGKAGVWTNPLDETKMVTSLDDLVYSPDFDTFEKGMLAKAKKRGVRVVSWSLTPGVSSLRRCT